MSKFGLPHRLLLVGFLLGLSGLLAGGYGQNLLGQAAPSTSPGTAHSGSSVTRTHSAPQRSIRTSASKPTSTWRRKRNPPRAATPESRPTPPRKRSLARPGSHQNRSSTPTPTIGLTQQTHGKPTQEPVRKSRQTPPRRVARSASRRHSGRKSQSTSRHSSTVRPFSSTGSRGHFRVPPGLSLAMQIVRAGLARDGTFGVSARVSRNAPLPRSPTGVDVENAISPINCGGTQYRTSPPFLSPPYHGFVMLYAYFDHDLPDFARNGSIVLASGLEATAATSPAAGIPVARNFPAYWSDALRQFVYYDGHNGYDFGLVYQPVYAAAPGRVIFAGWNYPGKRVTGYGKMVMIQHARGYVTLYGHMSKILVQSGQQVRRGQKIAVSGDTGHSTGPHLHFTVFHNCRPVDPYGWKGAGPDPLLSYEGVSSRYLWRTAPPLFNPLPGLPGLALIPAPPAPQALNLVLPHATSLVGLLRSLHREKAATVRALRLQHIPIHYDWAAAAFLFPHPLRPSRIYSLPFSASIIPDAYSSLSASEASFMDTLAQVVPTVKPRHLLVGGPWRAFVFKYGQRDYVLGRGPGRTKIEILVNDGRMLPTATISNATGNFAVPIRSNPTQAHPLIAVSTSGQFVLRPPGEKSKHPK